MINLARTMILLAVLMAACKPIQKTGPPKMKKIDSQKGFIKTMEASGVLKDILNQQPGLFEKILNDTENKVQIIYTGIDRDKNNRATFTDHFLNVNADKYFYPASTVKLPVAILALQKLNELNIPGLDMNSTMNTEADDKSQSLNYNDPTSAEGRPAIANYIKKILLVSDNDAFNRLYEFLGQEYINNTLHKLGYEDVQIIHRLEISLTEDQNRHTNPVRFFDTSGQLIYEKPAEKSKLKYANRSTKMGKGFYRSGQLINEPFDFSQKNRLTLQSLHNILRSIIFPESVTGKQRFNLKEEDYLFLRKYMSMFPQESKYPAYDSVNYWDHYVKFLLFGAGKEPAESNIRIFNKVGDAYGFLIDAAYVVDFKNEVEFMLSAIIHCNSDEIFNDDKYEYNTIGFPFMRNLGQVIYQYELKRKRKFSPDLKKIMIDYSN